MTVRTAQAPAALRWKKHLGQACARTTQSLEKARQLLSSCMSASFQAAGKSACSSRSASCILAVICCALTARPRPNSDQPLLGSSSRSSRYAYQQGRFTICGCPPERRKFSQAYQPEQGITHHNFDALL